MRSFFTLAFALVRQFCVDLLGLICGWCRSDWILIKLSLPVHFQSSAKMKIPFFLIFKGQIVRGLLFFVRVSNKFFIFWKYFWILPDKILERSLATTPSIYFCFLFHLSKNLLNFSHFSNTAHKTQIYALAKVFILNRNCSNCAVFIRLLPEQCLHKKTRSEPSSESGSKNFK